MLSSEEELVPEETAVRKDAAAEGKEAEAAMFGKNMPKVFLTQI